MGFGDLHDGRGGVGVWGEGSDLVAFRGGEDGGADGIPEYLDVCCCGGLVDGG